MVSYCHIGQRATVIYFTAKMLGYDAKMYDGSWEDWSHRKDCPSSPANRPTNNSSRFSPWPLGMRQLQPGLPHSVFRFHLAILTFSGFPFSNFPCSLGATLTAT